MVEGFQNTDYGIIPKDWFVSSIQELIDDKSIVSHLDGNHGELYPRSHEFISYGVPYIAANDFANGYVSFENCKYLSEKRAKLFRKGIAKNGDVLFAHNATVGPVALLETNLDFVILSTTATYFRCNPDKVLNIFLLYVLQSQFFIKQYKAVMLQSTRVQVPITAQRKFSIFLPTKTEQTAIATALNDADALIAKLEKLIAKKRNIKQGAIQELLKPKEGWVVKRLNELSEVKSGKRLPLGKSLVDKETSHPYIRVADMFYGGVSLNEIMYVPDDVYPTIKNYRIFIDDIFISVAGTLGIVGKIPPELNGANLTENADRLTNISCDKDYLLYVLMSFLIQSIIEAEKTLGAQPKLALTRIRKFKIILPPNKDEQTRIAKILSDMDAEIEALERKLEKYKMIKQGMMQNLLTGKIRLV